MLINEVIFQTGSVRVGRFRCTPDHPSFRDAGPITSPLVVFPRCPVWIEHERSRPFVADPNVASIYDEGQPYARAAIGTAGDRSDFFGVAPEVARSIASAVTPEAADTPAPFQTSHAPVDAVLYRRQRTLFLRIRARAIEPLEAEQEALEIVAAVLAAAVAPRPTPAVDARTRAAHEELVAAAKVELGRDAAAPTSVTDLAGRLGVSPFHLCRVFRRYTGTTLHGYRLDLRLRMALEEVLAPGANLSRVALRYGFCTHSHFTSVFRRRLGVSPAGARRTVPGARRAGHCRV